MVLSGCVGEPKCPSCSEAGSWSACSGEAVKTRTNYKCGEDTNFECQSFEETKNCATQILAKGKSVTMIISPSIYENGIYDLVSIAQKEGQSAPVDAAQAQIVIKN